MKKLLRHISLVFIVALVLGNSGCRRSSRITGDDIRAEITSRLEQQKTLTGNSSSVLFDMFNSHLTTEEKEALQYLYAYMPLSDLGHQDADFFLRQVRLSLQARQTFDWGNNIPNDLFLQYVLPIRVNNEYLDSARGLFFDELKERLRGMSLKEAALEVNHWCHEKVTYHSTDEYRTSSPMNTVKTAFGRCGEQSTFTVAAMRAACIPARQVYTPRWAHTDDNHAWVEVWVDGSWHFMGACEPETDLNRGWFEGPATRAMLMHTKVYGHLPTQEEVISQTDRFTEINLLNRYANTRKVFVKVLDQSGQPVEAARVEFQLVNFAEFYPLAVVETRNDGVAHLTTGMGDLMIWASKNGQYDYAHLDKSTADTLTLALNHDKLTGVVENFRIEAPEARAIPAIAEDRAAHNRRLFREDSLRAAYESSFIDSVKAYELAERIGYQNDKVWTVMKESRGNWQELKSFFEYAGNSKNGMAMKLVSLVSAKDRRDTPMKVFRDHFDFSDDRFCKEPELFNQYVLNPRIHNEMISAYKGIIRNYLGEDRMAQMRQNIALLAHWVHDSIVLDESANDWQVPVGPAAVLELKHADSNSYNIFFVAAARSIGVPARIEPVFKTAQVYWAGSWKDVNLQAGELSNIPRGILTLRYESITGLPTLPIYFKDFTLARFNGVRFETLDFSGSSLFESFPVTIPLPEGSYVLVTSVRLSDGSVQVRRSYFEIQNEKETRMALSMPEASNQNQAVDLMVDLNKTLPLLTDDTPVNVASLQCEDGLVLVWINPGLEPTKHLLNDLCRLTESFNSWQGTIVLLTAPRHITPGFNPGQLQGLPHRTLFLSDDTEWLNEISDNRETYSGQDYPVIMVLNHNNQVVYHSSGYRIGIGDDILNQLLVKCSINH